jgi:hypothetical protein
MSNNEQWLKDQQEYLEKQAPLRAAWLNGDEDAGEQLRQLIAESTAKFPPITGTFHYTQEQVDEAKRRGF